MGFRLTPQDTSFYDLFADLSRYLVLGAEQLTAVLGTTAEERKDIVKKMMDIEHQADEATHAIINRVNSSFITPFDREDIHDLAVTLDDCVDHMEAAVDLIGLYKIDDLLPRVSKQVEVLCRMADLTAESMPKLRSMRDLSDYWVEINRLENQADKAYRRLLAELFNSPNPDPITVMKQKEVIDELEAAADAFEKVAHKIESIAVKES
ncbi:MAG: DUF47 family protein [Nostocoides sp.]